LKSSDILHLTTRYTIPNPIHVNPTIFEILESPNNIYIHTHIPSNGTTSRILKLVIFYISVSNISFFLYLIFNYSHVYYQIKKIANMLSQAVDKHILSTA
jgi:hypothetical protein